MELNKLLYSITKIQFYGDGDICKYIRVTDESNDVVVRLSDYYKTVHLDIAYTKGKNITFVLDDKIKVLSGDLNYERGLTIDITALSNPELVYRGIGIYSDRLSYTYIKDTYERKAKLVYKSLLCIGLSYIGVEPEVLAILDKKLNLVIQTYYKDGNLNMLYDTDIFAHFFSLYKYIKKEEFIRRMLDCSNIPVYLLDFYNSYEINIVNKLFNDIHTNFSSTLLKIMDGVNNENK